MSEDERGKPLDFLEPFGFHLYVLMDERKSLSSIIITKDYQQITETGTVIALGDKAKENFKVGDKIVIFYNKGIHIQVKESYSTSKYHRILVDHEILCKINQEKRDAFNK